MDEILRITREHMTPPWDEMHEARILARILAATEEDDASAQQEAVRSSRRKRWLLAAVITGSFAAAAALAFFTVSFDGSREETPNAVVSPPPPSAHETLATTASELTFAPGTRALLDPGAQVTTLAQSDDVVSLRQDRGRVSYEVNPKGEQRFEVRARRVVVTVLGTQFVVDVKDDAVSVEVSEGVVSVQTGGRDLRLNAGETLRVATDEEPKSQELTHAASGESPSQVPPPAAPAAPRSVKDLLFEADAARQSGDLDRAESALRSVAYGHVGDARSTSALFSLGRVLRARGKPAEAAKAFAQVQARTTGALGEDALAEEAVSLAQAGNRTLAARRAAQYLRAHPDGVQSGRMKKLAGSAQ